MATHQEALSHKANSITRVSKAVARPRSLRPELFSTRFPWPGGGRGRHRQRCPPGPRGSRWPLPPLLGGSPCPPAGFPALAGGRALPAEDLPVAIRRRFESGVATLAALGQKGSGDLRVLFPPPPRRRRTRYSRLLSRPRFRSCSRARGGGVGGGGRARRTKARSHPARVAGWRCQQFLRAHLRTC